MGLSLRVGILSSIITAALVYVVLEWRPLDTTAEYPPQQSSTPEVTFAAPPQVVSASAPETGPSPDTQLLAPAGDTDEQNNIDIYRRYSRSVVNVASTVYSYNVWLQVVPSSGFGSGVVIDDEGHIVTNYHVIQDAANAQLEVTLADQTRHPATVVGADPNNDLALLHVDAPDVDWVPLPMGTTRGLQVGQKVLVIGNPFGLDRSLSTGIISSLGRSIEAPVRNRQVVIEGIIQTDAAINSGNSGGPVLNTDGELIGIATAIVSGATGIGFAVPADTVRRVTSDLLTYGRVRRVYLGISAINLSYLGSLSERLGLGTSSGVLLAALTPDGPAARAGLRGADRQIRVGNQFIPIGGDIVVGLDSRSIRSLTDITSALENHRPGDVVPIAIVRDGERLELEVELQEEPVMR